MGAAYYILEHQISGLLLATIMVVLEVLLTGGLHLDGLADTFDGIFSNRTKEQIFEIMKDPNAGTFGILSLILIIILKILFIHELDTHVTRIIILMPVVSRFSSVFSSYISTYAKENGLGNLFIGKVDRKKILLTLVLTLIPLWIYPQAIVTLFFIIVSTYFIVRMIQKKIDGITGDTLGAIVEINEIVYLAILVMMEGMVI
jgi:adenosylcobinamide-GDP ribazoletransferase